MIYGRGRNGSLVAVDAKTGKELWVRENMNGMTSRGMNYWESADGRDQRLIFAMNSLLQELDAKTGKSIMSFGTNGVVDLRVGIDGRDPATIGNIQSNTPGEVFENLIILGSATGEGYMSPPGDIRAYDVLTGKLVWTFHTVPRPGEFGYDTWPKDAWKYIGGVNNWGEMTVDTRRGIVYIPLGSPTYDFYGADRIGANLFGTSIVALDARTGKRLWHFQFVHHDLWDLDPSAAPQLTTIRHNGRNRDVVVVAEQDDLALRVRPRDRRADLADRGTSGAEVRHAGRSRAGRRSRIRPTRRRLRRQSFGVDDISPYLPADEADDVQEAPARPRTTRASSRRSATPTRCTSRRATAACSSAAWRPSPAPARSTSSRTTTPASCVCCGPARTPAAAAVRRRLPPGQAVYQQNCQTCHGPDRLGTDGGVPLHATQRRIRRTTSRPARRASTRQRFARSSAPAKDGCPRFRTSRAADVDDAGDVPDDGAPADAAAGRRWTRARRRSRGLRRTAGADRRIGFGVDATRSCRGGRGRGALPPYPDGVPQFERPVINEYNTVGNRIKPPFTSIVKYDLNEPRIKWRIGFGDDPALAARGITGTGVPALLNGIIVTESGLVFGAGRDNQIRAWDSDTGRQLWASRFGGNFVGSPVMYEMDGRQYLLVPAAGSAAVAVRHRLPTAPLGWVAYALPGQIDADGKKSDRLRAGRFG